jgi:hypothetical protein
MNRRRIAAVAVAAIVGLGGAALATSASARDSFSVSVGVPGVAVGYSNGYVPPPYYVAPAQAPAYVAPAPYYYGYGPTVVYTPVYQPYYRHYHAPHVYYRHW